LERRFERALYAMAVVVTLVTVLRPFWVATYPPLTDLPFHAAQTSVFRHYLDPSYHFREQFELSPIAVPYVSSYVLGALFMLVMPAVPAVKAATATMLLAVPAGLAVLAWGMKKTPLLGLLGLPFVWGNLTHWGFINFVSSLGIFAAVLGVSFRVLDRPSRRLAITLGGLLILLFFTHVFRYPYAIVALGIATLATYPFTKRLTRLVVPALPSLTLFSVFWMVRPKAVGSTDMKLDFDFARREQLLDYVIGSFADPAEAEVAKNHLIVAGFIAVLAIGYRLLAGWRPRLSWSFEMATTAVVVACVGVVLVGYFTLPMEIGIWWYVFPREATAALYLSMALVPDAGAPATGRSWASAAHPWVQTASAALMTWSAWSASALTARHYEVFDRATRDFAAITTEIPPAPRLLYLVFDHGGSTRRQTPFLHLPAYVQAERGGHLSFHFAMWDASPVRYRTDAEAIVPPPVPLRWEWQPAQFRVKKHAPFFDWFLVRSRSDPTHLFADDPEIQPVRHEGTWWLYRRER
jgi:hypothetical protein